MTYPLKFRPSPRTAASRMAAIQVLATLADGDEDFESVTIALRLLGVSDQELDAALLGHDLSGPDPFPAQSWADPFGAESPWPQRSEGIRNRNAAFAPKKPAVSSPGTRPVAS